ncbi:MAG: site-specific integrase [Thermoplasmatales archaeon]
MAFSGLRPGTLSNNEGTDGLVISDIPDLTVTGGKITFNTIPARIVVRRNISKTRKAYITFLGDEGCSYLEAYLRERMNQNENLTPDSPVITYSKSALKRGKFLKSAKVRKLVKETIRKAGFKLRPYVLRDYFDTRLMHAEEDRLIIRDYRTFWMGHKGDIKHAYTVGKNQLPKDTVERMRDSYERAMKLLETEQKRTRDKDAVREVREFAIMMIESQLGIKVDEEEMERLYSLETEEFKKELRKMTETKGSSHKNSGKGQKVLTWEEAEPIINSGKWRQVAPYGKDREKVII